MLADIPGLIEGAHEGRGLGDTFLGHVERCAVLLHLVDGTSETVAEDYRVIVRELEAYGAGLAAKPRVLGAQQDRRARRPRRPTRPPRRSPRRAALPVHRLSGATGQGVPEVLRALRAAIDAARAAQGAEADAAPWRP